MEEREAVGEVAAEKEAAERAAKLADGFSEPRPISPPILHGRVRYFFAGSHCYRIAFGVDIRQFEATEAQQAPQADPN